MNQSIELQVNTRIKYTKRGVIFFAENFFDLGSPAAVRKALERLTGKGELERVATGMYVRPRRDPVIGTVSPGTEDIAQAIAKRDKARIVPTGTYALHALGLSTQVPMNTVYLTDGAPRKVQVGKRKITFKKTSPKNVSAIGPISSLVIQALRTIGKGNLTEVENKKIRELLKQEKKTHLTHDIRMAPEWIQQIMKEALNE